MVTGPAGQVAWAAPLAKANAAAATAVIAFILMGFVSFFIVRCLRDLCVWTSGQLLSSRFQAAHTQSHGQERPAASGDPYARDGRQLAEWLLRRGVFEKFEGAGKAQRTAKAFGAMRSHKRYAWLRA